MLLRGLGYDFQGKLKKAEEMYRPALAGYEKALGRDHRRIRRLELQSI